MDNGGKRLAEILMQHGLLHARGPGMTSPTSPPAAMPQQGVTVPASPPQLPPFQLYQDSLPPMQDYMPPAAGPPQAPQQAPAMPMPQPAAMPEMPAPMQIGPQAAVAPQDMALAQALQQAQQRKLLPEQWRGSFSPGYGEPT